VGEGGVFAPRAIPEHTGPASGRGGPSYWQVGSADQVFMIWNDGFTGVTLALRKDATGLRGWAHPHFDAMPIIPRTAHVVARKVDCSSETAGPKAE
jgi:hypothetical protein